MPICTANMQFLFWENAEEASDSLEPAGHKQQQWIGQGALLCGGHCHQLTARERVGIWGSACQWVREQREIPEKPWKYFENGDPTQRGKCSMTLPNTALGKQRAAQLLGYLTPASRSAAPFPGAACSWWLRVISSMRFHVWSLFSVWQLLRLSEGVSWLSAGKLT